MRERMQNGEELTSRDQNDEEFGEFANDCGFVEMRQIAIGDQ